MWFERDLARQLSRPSLPVRIMVGPRQCGKSALIAHMKPETTWLSLDDIQVRLRAQEDPALLLETSGARPSDPVVLDEAAYAPNLFPEVKRRIDLARRRGEREPEFWITGSNRLLLDREVRESLAGRANYSASPNWAERRPFRIGYCEAASRNYMYGATWTRRDTLKIICARLSKRILRRRPVSRNSMSSIARFVFLRREPAACWTPLKLAALRG